MNKLDFNTRIIHAHYPKSKILSATKKVVAIPVTEYELEGGIFVYASSVHTLIRRPDGKPFEEVKTNET